MPAAKENEASRTSLAKTLADADGIDQLAESLLSDTLTPKRSGRTHIAASLRGAESWRSVTPGGEVTGWRAGSGPACLLIHGWSDSHLVWDELIAAFRSVGKAVVAVDLPGHGINPSRQTTVPEASSALAQAVAALGPIDSLVAHSFGCSVAVHVIQAGLTCSRTVLLAPPIPGLHGKWVQAIERGVSRETIDRAYRLYEARTGISAEAFDIEAAVEKMNGKALFLHSMDDMHTPFSNSERLSSLWPNARLIMMTGLGHRSIASDPAAVSHILTFVA